ncbi:hypothetical protein EMCG_01192 [[Emmonsia] crescens]|uniref:Uncharacterized protein n=1 Tax=[Emmonsia] crescens TaxID=73230 RepID=A0A0G2I5A9_9EURO|nr:hypothetical protein EMCG_01192 [Emmonsia crescens UAMH 3008]
MFWGYVDLNSRVATDPSQPQFQLVGDTIQHESSTSTPPFPNHPLTPESSSHLKSDEDEVHSSVHCGSIVQCAPSALLRVSTHIVLLVKIPLAETAQKSLPDKCTAILDSLNGNRLKNPLFQRWNRHLAKS